MGNTFDIVIAGGGLAGLLSAIRIADQDRTARVAILERAPAIGGRLRNSSTGRAGANYGLDAISPRLFDFCNVTLRLDPECPDLAEMGRQDSEFGVMITGKVKTAPLADIASPKGARLLGGLAASKDWKDLREIIPSSEEGDVAVERAGAQAFSNVWLHPRKAAPSVALEYVAAAMGIPDPWDASGLAVSERAQLLAESRFRADWSDVFSPSIGRFQNLTLLTSCPIVDASESEGRWKLLTPKGELLAQKLVVAQPPWDVTTWLPKQYCPTAVLSISSKTKPVSSVVLAQKISKDSGLPPFLFIPAEDAVAVLSGDELCLRTTIDFELSLQAPAVMKAVKSLKRAKKKLQLAYPDIVFTSEHLALLPVTWAQSVSHSEKKWIDKIDLAKINKPNLAFCGDSYGPTYNYDENLVTSVIDACRVISSAG